MRWNGRKGGRASRNLDSDHIDERNHSRKHGFRACVYAHHPGCQGHDASFGKCSSVPGLDTRTLGSQDDQHGWGVAATGTGEAFAVPAVRRSSVHASKISLPQFTWAQISLSCSIH